MNSPSQPTDWFAQIAASSRALLNRAPQELINRVVTRQPLYDLEYGTGVRQRLDLYLTPHARGTVMFIHGGYWDSGDKSDYPFLADAICRLGFNAAIINYRLSPENVFPEFVTDAALAVRWLHENLERFGDTSANLFVMGHSAGAHITALLCCDGRYLERVGVSRHLIRGAIGMAGPYDFLDWIPGDERMQIAFGGPERWADTQPVLRADGHNPKMLLLHGERDSLCTPLHAPALRDAILKRGGQAVSRWYPRLDHFTILGAFSRIARWLEPRIVEDVAQFLNEAISEASTSLPAPS